MSYPSPPEEEKKYQCTHCWIEVCESDSFGLNGKRFCTFKCLIQYYRCIITLFLSIQRKKWKIYILHKKGWSTGIVAGLILSFILIGIFAIIVSSPVSGPPQLPPITEATFDMPVVMTPAFFPKAVTLKTDKHQRDHQAGDSGLKDIQKRVIKEWVKIDLVKEYPMEVQKTLGICGQAPSGSICALYLNDALYEAATCINGKFFFPRVAVSPGKNIIEVVAHDPQGYTIPSNRIELFVDLNRRITERGRNITRGSLKHPKVCLTFDGGASAFCAPEILQILARYSVRCTFFLTGDFMRNHPDLVKAMIDAGHEIGNHTDTHPHLARLTSQMRFETLPWVNREFIQNQLKKAEGVFFQITGQRMAPFWRTPYGEHNLDILGWAQEIGYTHVSWTCGRILEDGLDTLDWVYNTESPIYYTAEEIRDKIIHYGEDTPEGANGGIILMHLASSRPIEDRVHRQLPSIIEGLRKKGYQLSRVSEVMNLPQNPLAQKPGNQNKTKPPASKTGVKRANQNRGRRRVTFTEKGAG